ncbi:MAG: hypothetical protein ACTHJK_06975, partial [Sphingomicrobium sp.]
MRKLFILGALCTTTLMASPAFAEAPTGFRVEGLVGFDKLIKKDNVYTDTDIATGASVVSAEPVGTYDFGRLFDTSLVYGGRVGYDFGFGSGFSLGVDAEVTNTNAHDAKTLQLLTGYTLSTPTEANPDATTFVNYRRRLD